MWYAIAGIRKDGKDMDISQMFISKDPETLTSGFPIEPPSSSPYCEYVVVCEDED
jgi:hypothetical protein